MRTERGEEPIAELAETLKERGRPSFTWIERWTSEGGDPVMTTWQRARASFASMLRVLLHARRREDWSRARDAVAAVPRGDDTGAYRAACCDAIRAVVPDPPSLDEVTGGVDKRPK